MRLDLNKLLSSESISIRRSKTFTTSMLNFIIVRTTFERTRIYFKFIVRSQTKCILIEFAACSPPQPSEIFRFFIRQVLSPVLPQGRANAALRIRFKRVEKNEKTHL